MQREHRVPYERPVKNDANGGFEQELKQGNVGAGQRFVLNCLDDQAIAPPCSTLVTKQA